MDTHLLNVFLQKVIPPQAFVIAFVIMAITGMTTADEYGISTLPEGLQNKSRFYPTGTHYPDNPYIRDIF
jgi:hypothetical protein